VLRSAHGDHGVARIAHAARGIRLHDGAMKALVLYASRHGHTRRVAESISAALGKRGWIPDLRDVASNPPAGLEEYAVVILASPIHVGRHARRIVSFARRHHQALEALPSALVSVSLTQINAESLTVDAEQRKRAHEGLSVVLDRFIEATGWRPRAIIRVAGALAYTRYNWFVRWMMRRIAKAEGGSTDTSRDHVYTNWAALERAVSDFVEGVGRDRDVNDAITRG
jgi:menaquinone-dependent protoporphyrinogen oxidase